jgi:Holliday junction resolvase RusA-like endonuclease
MKIRSPKDIERYGFPDYIKEQLLNAFKKKNDNRATNTASNMEQSFINKQMGAKEGSRFVNPVRINIFSTRKRQTDNCAISEKAVIDALIKNGILKDDTKEYIKELVVHEPEISKTEKTIIDIVEL